MEYDLSFYMELLENLEVGIFVLDGDGNYLYANPAYCKDSYHSREFYLKTSIPELKKRGFLTRTVYDQVYKEKKTVHAIVSCLNTDPSLSYDALTLGIPYFDDNGNIKYIFYIQERLDQLNRRLQTGSMSRIYMSDSGDDRPNGTQDIIAESPQMKQILINLKAIAKTDAAILISGPSGSGKEVLANYVHNTSPRKDKPLIILNCAAIPETLIESELFGYEKGSFTGASSGGKTGLIEAADGGTLFLDEINSIPLAFQAKLLRVLETKKVTRIGAVKSCDVDFRLICASNEDLHKLVLEKRFRSDLFYRINVLSVLIPPLNQRPEDIIALALHYLQYFCAKYSCVKVLSEQALATLENYSWPGNVRELKNFIERLVVTSPEDLWEFSDIPAELFDNADYDSLPIKTNAELYEIKKVDPAVREDNPQTLPPVPPVESLTLENFSYHAYMDECEKNLLLHALQAFKNPAEAAKALKINLSSVYRKMQKYDIQKQIRYPDGE